MKRKTLCPRCSKNPAIIDSVYGVIECKNCQEFYERPHLGVEFTTDSIREQRMEYRKDIVQPYHDGVLSKEYVEVYGTKGLNIDEKEVKKAKYTYKGVPNYWNRDKSKGGR
jgi:hypothetical protein